MNALQKQTSDIIISGNDRAKQIYGVCTIVTPQFYKNKTDNELLADIKTIELLTHHIDNEVLTLMCQRATESYQYYRSKSNKVHFDINYILTFYINCFNELYNVLPNTVNVFEKYSKDKATGIVTEVWSNRGIDGEQATEIATKRYISKEVKNESNSNF